MISVSDWAFDGPLSPIVLLIFGAIVWQCIKHWRNPVDRYPIAQDPVAHTPVEAPPLWHVVMTDGKGHDHEYHTRALDESEAKRLAKADLRTNHPEVGIIYLTTAHRVTGCSE